MANLKSFDRSLMRAGASLGAGPLLACVGRLQPLKGPVLRPPVYPLDDDQFDHAARPEQAHAALWRQLFKNLGLGIYVH